MTKVHLTLPDDLAKAAAKAGLLSGEAVESMLREKLRSDGAKALASAWQRMDGKTASAEDEADIAEAIRLAKATRKAA